MNKLTINLDSTVLGHAACIRRLKWKVVDGYTEPLQSASIIYGVAIHKFIDTMFKTKGDYALSVAAATKAFEIPKFNPPARSGHLADTRHMLTVAINYWESWIKKDQTFQVLEQDGVPMTEYTFSIKFYEDDYITVNLCGTIDTIGKIVNGVPCIRDFKTTSAWDGTEYFSQYQMSRQLRIYALALRLMSRYYPDSLLGTIGSGRIGAVIDGVFIKPAPNDSKFLRSETFIYGDEELNEIEDLIRQKCFELSVALSTSTFPKQGLLNGSCMGKWGKCLFWNVCGVKPEIAEILLKRDFKVKLFNPLKYNEVEVE